MRAFRSYFQIDSISDTEASGQERKCKTFLKDEIHKLIRNKHNIYVFGIKLKEIS